MDTGRERAAIRSTSPIIIDLTRRSILPTIIDLTSSDDEGQVMVMQSESSALHNGINDVANNVQSVRKKDGRRLTLSPHRTRRRATRKSFRTYAELKELEELVDIIWSSEEFDCSICCMNIETSKGIVLRNCLHHFCGDCVIQLILLSDDVNVKCPFITNDFQCNEELQDREIRSLLTKDQFEEYLMKSINAAEQSVANSFHCKLPNCHGWCECDENVHIFNCPVCNCENCINCGAIHTGKTCREYQNTLLLNEADQETRESIEKIIDKGEAMRCPKCQVIIVKRDGCDFLRCTMCKVEICWATKGLRWGPQGVGDTSGGCRCGVNKLKCHPSCRNCH